jgi:pimeloyl-ACP methyl ester carboxylesterase
MDIILLHGSWHGAWCWHKIAPRLRAQAHRVHVPDLPAHGRDWRIARGRITLKAMATSVCEIVDALDEPALIVAHSRGGIVASTVAQMRPDRVQGVVYLAAYMLRDGERVADLFREDRDSLVPRNLTISRASLTDMLRPACYREVLYADCADADIELAHSLLTPEPSLPALTRVRLSGDRYGRVRRHYIELTEDRAVSPALQRRMIAATPCDSVTAIRASHSAYFSRPDELSGAIAAIAART